MARFEIVGLTDLRKEMEQEAIRAEKKVPEMLKAGAEVVSAVQKREAEEMIRSGKLRFPGNKSRSTGALVRSIKPTGVKGKGADAHIEIYPQGSDEKKTRNAEKGFLAEYGTKTMPSFPWMNLANEKASVETTETMQEIWNKE